MKHYELVLQVEDSKDFETGVTLTAYIKAIDQRHATLRTARFIELMKVRGTKYSWLWYLKQLKAVIVVSRNEYLAFQKKIVYVGS